MSEAMHVPSSSSFPLRCRPTLTIISLQLKPHTRLELPLWLAEMLAVSQPGTSAPLLTLDLPSALSPRVMNALSASPLAVDLRSLAPHFYALAVRLLELFEEEEMSEILTQVRGGLLLGVC